jgi:hypothetical protein
MKMYGAGRVDSGRRQIPAEHAERAARRAPWAAEVDHAGALAGYLAGSTPAPELVASYLLDRAQRLAGPRAVQGERPAPLDDQPGALGLLARRKVWRVDDAVAAGLVAWAHGQRRVHVHFHVPTAREILALQARGERCVSLLADGTATAPHADGFAFANHDLCHLEKFVDPECHEGQVGFFSLALGAVESEGWRRFDKRFDQAWVDDYEHVVADMNGSPLFLFSALKMKLRMATRRELAKIEGREAPTTGPLSPREEEAFAANLDEMLQMLRIEGKVGEAGRRVTARRDAPEHAEQLHEFFTAVGSAVLGQP